MKNTFVYPFTDSYLPILNYQKDLLISPILTPDKSFIEDNLYMLDNYTYYNDFKKNYRTGNINHEINYACVKNIRTKGNYRFIVNYSNKLMLENKEIKFYLDKIDVMNIEIIDKNLANKIKIEKYSSDKFIEKILSNGGVKGFLDVSQNSSFKKIKSKIISIGSIISDKNKMEVCLSLYKHLTSEGKKVTCILSNSFYSELGLYTISYNNLFTYGIDFAMAIINSFFEYVYKCTKCEYIICDIPGNLLKYDNKFISDNTITANLILNSLNVDTLICCVPFSKNGLEYYTEIGKEISRNLPFGKLAFHMSNYVVDYEINFGGNYQGFYIDKSNYTKEIEKINSKMNIIYDLREYDSLKKLSDDLKSTKFLEEK